MARAIYHTLMFFIVFFAILFVACLLDYLHIVPSRDANMLLLVAWVAWIVVSFFRLMRFLRRFA